MKTEGQIRHKLQQVTYRHLQRGIRTALSCRPENCSSNGSVKLPTGTLHFCSIKQDEEGDFIPCDEAFGGLEQAAKCGDFQCANTKEGVKESLTKFLRTSDVATIATQYPDVAALLWALNEDVKPIVIDVDPDPQLPPPPPITILYLLPDGSGAVQHPKVSHTLSFHRALTLSPPQYFTEEK